MEDVWRGAGWLKKGQKRRGYPSGSQNRWWTLNSSWMSTQGGGLGTPHWSVVLHEMFLHTTGQGQKEAECMFCQGCWGSVPEPEPRADQSAMELVGYWMSRKEMRDIHYSVYLLRRSPGSPSCGEWQRRRAIHDILSSLMVQLQRQMHPAATKDISPHTGGVGWIGPAGILWSGSSGSSPEGIGDCQSPPKWPWKTWKWTKEKITQLIPEARVGLALETQSRTCSRNWSRTCSRGWSRNCARANSQSHFHGDLWGICPQSPDGPLPRRRVSFHKPKDIRDPIKEEVSCLMEPSIDDPETWLEFQVGQVGTPTWWEELGAVPGIEDQCKFAQKIRASFYVLEVWLRASPEWGYTAPPAPWILNRGAFHLERFTYQDVRQQPALLTIAYARCLQHWAEKHNLPRNLDFCPWVECVRELWQTVQEFVNINYQDVMQGLEVEKPKTSHLQPKTTIFSWVLATLVDEQKAIEAPPHPVSPCWRWGHMVYLPTPRDQAEQ